MTKPPMRTTLYTHNDLDGYGASTVVARCATLSAIHHVARYADLTPILEAHVQAMAGRESAERVMLADLGLDHGTIGVLATLADVNGARIARGQVPHEALVLDHHRTTSDALRQGPVIANVRAVVDLTRCATRIAFDERPTYADPGRDLPDEPDSTLVALVDAVDLWRKDDPAFGRGMAVNDAFWEHVATFVPFSHPLHDGFMSSLLLRFAGLAARGLDASRMEAETMGVRMACVEEALAGDPSDDRSATTRFRMAALMARTPKLFLPVGTGLGTLHVSFGLDLGVYQRVSDLVLEADPQVATTANVTRGGGMSFRSCDGSALRFARRFKGGGHDDAAGGSLPDKGAFSIEDAVRQIGAVLPSRGPRD